MKHVRWFPVLALAVVGTSAHVARAQSAAPYWTIFGGVNLANIEGPTDMNKEPLMGKAFGVGLDWRVNRIFAFQPELQYAEKGYQYDAGVPVRLKLTYIQIPLLMRATAEPADNGMGLYGLAGPSVAMRRSCGASVGSANGKCNVLGQNMSTMDFSMIMGVGLDFKIRSTSWTTSLRYDLGLLDTDKTKASAKTRAFDLVLGWRP